MNDTRGSTRVVDELQVRQQCKTNGRLLFHRCSSLLSICRPGQALFVGFVVNMEKVEPTVVDEKRSGDHHEDAEELKAAQVEELNPRPSDDPKG